MGDFSPSGVPLSALCSLRGQTKGLEVHMNIRNQQPEKVQQGRNLLENTFTIVSRFGRGSDFSPFFMTWSDCSERSGGEVLLYLSNFKPKQKHCGTMPPGVFNVNFIHNKCINWSDKIKAKSSPLMSWVVSSLKVGQKFHDLSEDLFLPGTEELIH